MLFNEKKRLKKLELLLLNMKLVIRKPMNGSLV